MVLSQNANLSEAFSGSRALVTGGLGFIGSQVARHPVDFGAHVTLIDNLVPEYGGNWFNVANIQDRITNHVGHARVSLSEGVTKTLSIYRENASQYWEK
jgi:nucleoside-diphosphate-sugar epimerase